MGFVGGTTFRVSNSSSMCTTETFTFQLCEAPASIPRFLHNVSGELVATIRIVF